MKYRKRPIVIEATQWFKNGDHPEDNCEMFDAGKGPFQGEGKIVRYFRHPDIDGQTQCSKCGNIMHFHGWIDTLEDGHNVCPGDWIITGIKGELYPCKPDIFEMTYEKVESEKRVGLKNGIAGCNTKPYCFLGKAWEETEPNVACSVIGSMCHKSPKQMMAK